MSFTTPCETSMKGCQVVAASANKLPWMGELAYVAGVATQKVGTAAKPMGFSYTLGTGCGLLSNSVITATATGPVNAFASGHGCVKYKKAGNFNLSLSGLTAVIDAEECLTVGGQELIAK